MKVIITPPNPPKKEYSNLPEREPHRDLLRKQRKEAQERDSAAQESVAERATFGPAVTATATEEAPGDFVSDLLADHDPVEHVEDHSWRNSRWVPVTLLVAVAVLGGIWYFATHFESGLGLDRITVTGAQLLRDQEIIQLAGIDRDQKFYDIDLKKIEANLLRHSLIKSAHPHREVNPATIVLDVEERQPVAMVRSESNGEAYIIDRDGFILRPKLLAGLKDPVKIMQVPLLTGVPIKDTVGLRFMSKLVTMMQSLEGGSLKSALGELYRTPTGAYVLYTVETQTPIFIGSPNDAPFTTAVEEQRNPGAAKQAAIDEPLFIRQIKLLARLWQKRLEHDLRSNSALYVDARFNGQVIVKQKQASAARLSKATTKDSSHAQLLTSVTTSPSARGQQ